MVSWGSLVQVLGCFASLSQVGYSMCLNCFKTHDPALSCAFWDAFWWPASEWAFLNTYKKEAHPTPPHPFSLFGLQRNGTYLMVFTHVTSSLLIPGNKRIYLHKSSIKLQGDCFGPPTCPLFLCFGLPMSLPWFHVKTSNNCCIYYFILLLLYFGGQ